MYIFEQMKFNGEQQDKALLLYKNDKLEGV